MTWTPVSNPQPGLGWGLNDRHTTIHPVCKHPGCTITPAGLRTDICDSCRSAHADYQRWRNRHAQ